MDPFNSNSKTPATKPLANNATPQGDPVHGHKKRVLQTLMHAALGTPGNGRNVHDTAHGIKTAIGAYKNYAKQWDELHGMDGSGGPGTPGVPAPQANPNAQGRPQTPPGAPNLQLPAQAKPPSPPIAQQMVQPPRPPMPVLPPQAQVPQQAQPLIQRPMPAFMGGGHPAGY